MNTFDAEAGSVERRRRNLWRVMQPCHVAVIGGNAAEEAARQLDAVGFEGPVWPVNPKRDTIAGRSCFRAVEDLPEAPDAVVIAVPASACPDTAARLAAMGAGGGICFSARFAEDGDHALERELVAAAGDMALVGPNCHGVLNYLDGAVLWPDEHGGERVARGAAFISQSGNVAMNATFHRRSVPLAYVVGTGNQAQLDVGDFVDAMLDDERVDAIGLFVEGLKDVGRFARAARRALEKGVPLVALKIGRSDEAARAALSHTSALAGADAVYEALFERLGVLRVESMAELLETLKVFSLTGRMGGNRVLSLSCSGGEAALMADAGAAVGLRYPAPDPALAVELAKRLSIPADSIGNPLDYNTHVWGDPAATASAFELALSQPYDAAALVLDFPRAERCDLTNWRVAMNGLIAARQHRNVPAAVISVLPESFPEEDRAACANTGIAPLQGLREGVVALAAAGCYEPRRRQLLDEAIWPGPPSSESPTTEAVAFDEAAAKHMLADFGLPVPNGKVVATASEAAEAARAIGFPVAVKAVGADIAHKSELGAVALDLTTEDAVVESVAAMTRSLETAGVQATGWLVEDMVSDSVAELLVGVVRDAVAGPVLVIGDGGVLAELVAETRTLLLPTTPERIRAAIESLKSGALLRGYRGKAAGDIDAAVAACMAVAHFTEANAGHLAELDVNPLLVRPQGRGAVAADAFMRFYAPCAETGAMGQDSGKCVQDHVAQAP
ncbi:acetate--CoA ligase family protein [Ferruginivarius sediminum]|uniref:CoA-binding protein n=1 Tax=Ferruginivarius sediminum TaxID=2661937 RepID=A0A369TBF8_9PROT|nr:acetate--CoA ligase family protein [Ferruginivarius sediminum]RDD60266.1 CoA-binding protein [Ferruginivarius sediminum]